MAAERVNCPCSGENFSGVGNPPRDEVFLASTYRNSFPIDNQSVAALHNEQVLVKFVDVGSGGCRRLTCPKRYLASLRTIEDIALNSGSCLSASCNLVCGVLHEFGEFIHGRNYGRV